MGCIKIPGRGILSKIWKRFRREGQKVKSPIDEWIREHKHSVLYLGNGADGICYRDMFAERHMTGQELSFGADGVYMAVCEVPKDAGQESVFNGFTNTQAEFTGFWARKREKGKWFWYLWEQGWQPLSGDMAPKRLFMDGDSLRELFDGDTKLVVLEAQWKHLVTGKPVRKGYPMFSHELMAHAFGALDGHTYCNTRAAYENAAQNGYEYFEFDLSFTEDERLILCHGWDEKGCKTIGVPYSDEFAHMTYDRAMQLKVHGDSVMDTRQFYREMQKRPQDVFEVDLHTVHEQELEKRIHALLEDFSYDTQSLDRLLIQVMDQAMFRQTDAVHHFKHYQFLVGNKIRNLDGVLHFCLDHGICAVAMRANFATPEMINKIKNAGLYVMCYTIKKDADFVKYLLSIGVDTICTDYVTPKALANAKDTFGHKPYYTAYVPGEDAAPTKEHTVLCQNDGTDTVRKNPFQKEGALFVGYHLRVTIDKAKYWYCTDALYHGNIDFGRKVSPQKCLFAEGDRLPKLLVKENMTAELIAVWKEDEL